MDWKKRLLRRPGTTLLWIVLGAVMAAFLTVAAALWVSSARLSAAVDARHTAIAVRTDRAVSSHYIQGGMGWDTEERSFPQEERDWLESQESVEAVRIHTLSAAYSPNFEPLLGLRRELSWRGVVDTRSYSRVILTATVADIYRGYGGEQMLLLEVEQMVTAHPEYEATWWRSQKDGACYVSATVGVTDQPDFKLEDYFVRGGRYVLSGDYHAERVGNYWVGDELYNTPYLSLYGRLQGERIEYYPLIPDRIFSEGESDENVVYPDPEPTGDYARYAYPVCQPIEGDVEEFFANEPFWGDYRAALERQLHSLPVLGTENLESVTAFVQNDARIIEGRSFTPEEYETGAPVLVISEAEAQRTGLTVGDRVRLRQYLVTPPDDHIGITGALNSSADIYRWDGRLNRPSVGDVDPMAELGEEEEFEIVGVYRLTENWPNGSYAFTADTVFMPQKAQIPGAFGPASSDLYGVYLSVELRNGMVDEFRLALAGSPYAGEFYPIEQGFEQVQRDLNGLRFSSARLAAIALGAWGIWLLLVLLMYQGAQRHNLGVMRSQGASPLRAAGYLFSSGLVTAALGIVLGTALSAWLLHLVQGQILTDALAKVDYSVFSGSVMTEEELASLVEGSALGSGQLVLFAAAQLCVLALLMAAQAWLLARQRPRKLMGV